MSGIGSGWWPYAFILVAGFAATDIWRFVGVVMSARIDEASGILRWVRAVATALIAGLVARLILFPVGDLAQVAPFTRYAAVAAGLAAFIAFRRNMLAGIIAGEAALFAALYLVSG